MSESLKQLPELLESRQIYDQPSIDKALHAMAADINVQLGELKPLVITLLNGGQVFAGKLLPLLDFPLQQDYLHATRYGDAVQGENLRWYAQPTSPLKDRVILLLDDIYDRGFTLEAVYNYCKQQGAKAVYSAVLLEKQFSAPPQGGIASYRADFIGLSCEDEFVVGCGMDYQGFGRNIPGIYALKGFGGYE